MDFKNLRVGRIPTENGVTYLRSHRGSGAEPEVTDHWSGATEVLGFSYFMPGFLTVKFLCKYSIYIACHFSESTSFLAGSAFLRITKRSGSRWLWLLPTEFFPKMKSVTRTLEACSYFLCQGGSKQQDNYDWTWQWVNYMIDMGWVTCHTGQLQSWIGEGSWVIIDDCLLLDMGYLFIYELFVSTGSCFFLHNVIQPFG